MTKRSLILILLIVFLAGFLIGFVPQYVEGRRFQASLGASISRLEAANTELRLAQLRDLSGLMLLEVMQRNYGTARDHATQYFEKLRQEAGRTQDPGLKMKLEDLLQQRDSVISALAQGDPASAATIESLFARTHEATRSE